MKLTNVAKRKQTHRCTGQMSGFQWERQRGGARQRCADIQTTISKIKQLQGYTTQHGECSQLFCSNYKWNVSFMTEPDFNGLKYKNLKINEHKVITEKSSLITFGRC